MFFRKTERKKHSVTTFLIIGALATIGAMTLAKNGKEIVRSAGCKVMGFFKKESTPSLPCEQDGKTQAF